MSEVIQPAPGQTVITTDNHNHRDHGHRGHDEHFRETRLDADYRALTNEVERFGTLAGDRVRDVGTATALAASVTDGRLLNGFGGVHDKISGSTDKVKTALDTGFTAEALAACKLSDEIAETKLATAIGFKDSIIAGNVGFSAATVQASAIGSAGQVLATAFANQASNQATMYANAQTVLTERVRAELALAQTTGFAAAQLYAAQNKADSDAKAAKCCCDAELQAAQNFAALQAQADRNACDIKMLVTADGNVTRALINQNTIDDLRAFKASIPRGVAVTVPVSG